MSGSFIMSKQYAKVAPQTAEVNEIIKDHPYGRITEPTSQLVHLTWCTSGCTAKITLYVGAANRSRADGSALPMVGVADDIFGRNTIDGDELAATPDPVEVQTLQLNTTQRIGLATLIKNPELIEQLDNLFLEVAHAVAQKRRTSGEFFGSGNNPAGRALRDEIITQLRAKADRAEVINGLLNSARAAYINLSVNADHAARRMFPELY